MFRVLGITSTDRRLLLTFANSIVSCFCAICGSATNDMIGRRTKLWIGSIVLSCLFACVTGFSSQFGVGMPVNLPVSNAGIASVSPALVYQNHPLTSTDLLVRWSVLLHL
jgi:hypothetical protein